MNFADSVKDGECWVALCAAVALSDGGAAVAFDVLRNEKTCSAFAVRYQGRVHAYLNRCTHVAIELDWTPNEVFDSTRRWLMCSTHGAMYQPDTGACAGGPCRGGLLKIPLMERDGQVFWRAHGDLRPPVGSPLSAS
jgi:nitrite reductase/ring-hydroxylating ferredoxin subunit